MLVFCEVIIYNPAQLPWYATLANFIYVAFSNLLPFGSELICGGRKVNKTFKSHLTPLGAQ